MPGGPFYWLPKLKNVSFIYWGLGELAPAYTASVILHDFLHFLPGNYRCVVVSSANGSDGLGGGCLARR